MTAGGTRPAVARMWAFAAGERGALMLGTSLLLLASAATLGIPWAGGRFAEAVMASAQGQAVASGPPPIGPLLGVLLAFIAVQIGAHAWGGYVVAGAVERVVSGMRIAVYERLVALPLAFHEARRHGETVALVTHDAHVVGAYAGTTLLAVIPMLVTVTGAAGLMLHIDARLSLVALAAIPLLFVALKAGRRWQRPLAVALRDEETKLAGLVTERLSVLPAIKTFGREAAEGAAFRAQATRLLALTLRRLRVDALLAPGLQLAAAVAVIAVLWLAYDGVMHGSIAPANLVAFLLYGQLMLRPVAGLSNVYGATQTAKASLARVLEVLDEPGEPLAGSVAGERPTRAADIVFERVSFSYPGRPALFDGLDARFAGGGITALVGPNGAGKSTLLRLLARLDAPQAGCIRVGDVDIASLPLDAVRGALGVVPQTVALLNASIRDNIAFGRDDADDAQIERAARLALAHDFIARLPQRYATVIGDRGVRLSGGQQQRIALARALLKDPPILVFDEATAMFDEVAEQAFFASCSGALRGRTVIVITHRPAGLAAADHVVRLG
ncbi:MAG: ABC transporter ATP-binding protein [Proteobacteria bacterium]|nr:ABC transporter ATP-binding protein [Pseudomonadota bacterium]